MTGSVLAWSALLFLLGPLAILIDNRDEFMRWSLQLVMPGLIGFALVSAGLISIGLALGRWRTRGACVLAAATILMWLQSALPGRFTLLDGSEIDWATYRSRGLAEVVVWLVAIVGAWIGSRRLRGLILPVLGCVVFAQVGTIVVSASTTDLERDAGAHATLARLARLSSQRNVVLLILDGVQRDYVTEILRGDAQIRSGFRGFRLFTDHLAVFPTTRFSIPAMLSGQVYENKRPARDFIEEAYRGDRSIAHTFRQEGFDVGIASTVREALKFPADHRLGVELSRAVRRSRGWSPGLELLDLSLFRFAPVVAKEWIFNEDEWRLRRLSGGSKYTYHAARSLNFLGAFTEELHSGGERPSLRVIHVGGAHPPVILDSECRYIGVQPLEHDAYREQVECALRQVLDLLQQLETLGILDQTFLVITSDHGIRVRGTSSVEKKSPALDSAMQRAGAFLMIKPFDSRAVLEFDERPTSARDLPIILESGIDGWDEEDETLLSSIARPTRERTFMHHAWQKGDWRKPHLTSLYRFSVGAGSSSVAAWTHVETLSAAKLSESERAQQRAVELSFASGLPPS